MESVQHIMEGLNISLVYSAFVGAGLIFSIIAFLFGGDHGDGGADHGGDGPGCFISPIGLAFFTTSFGAYGLIFYHGFEISPMKSVIVSAVLAGITMSILNYFFFKLFVKSGAIVKNEKIEGLKGEVFTAIPQAGVGEILYRDSRGRQKALAREVDGKALPSGTIVRIESALGTTLVVSKYESGGPDNATPNKTQQLPS